MGRKLTKPGLSLVAHRQDHHGVRLLAVPRQVTTVAKGDHPFAERLREPFDRAAHGGLLAKLCQCVADALGGALRDQRALAVQELAQALEVTQGCR